MKSKAIVVATAALCATVQPIRVTAEVVSFKDAAKIKSWDAWNDHKKVEAPKEKQSVTWRKLNSLNPGLKEIGRLAVRGAKDDLYRFSCVVIDEYFRGTREAVKAFDPQLLYLGCRFAGGTRDEVAIACARHCDVVSYNIYQDTIGGWRLPGGIDAPVMIGEFHFGATDRGPFGTGVRQAENQVDRAEKMKAYVRSALGNPQIVGVHWHQFSDQATSGRFDGEYLQVGWTDICDTPYPEAVSALRQLAGEIYSTRSAIGKIGDESLRR